MTSKTKLNLRSTLIRSAVRDALEAQWMLRGGKIIETEEMLLGSIVHCLILEPDVFFDRYAVFSGTRGGKEYKALLTNNTKTPVPIKSYDKAKEMSYVMQNFLASNKCPTEVKKLFDSGIREEEIIFEDDNYVHSIRPDIYDKQYFLDLKTCYKPTANSNMWASRCMDARYDLQLAYYSTILEKAKGIDVEGAYHLVQSTAYPYCIDVFFFEKSCLNELSEDLQMAIITLDDLYQSLYKTEVIDLISFRDRFDNLSLAPI